MTYSVRANENSTSMQITAIAVDEDALDGVGSLSGIQCSHVRAGEDLLTQMSQPAASQACHLINGSF